MWPRRRGPVHGLCLWTRAGHRSTGSTVDRGRDRASARRRRHGCAAAARHGGIARDGRATCGAARPMRVSVRTRSGRGGGWARWGGSVAAALLRRDRTREMTGERGREEVRRIPHLVVNLMAVSFSAETQRAPRSTVAAPISAMTARVLEVAERR